MNPELPKVLNLLEQLTPGDVETNDKARALVSTGGEEYTFTSDECEMLLQSASSVRKFHEALGSPEDAEITVWGCGLNTDAIDAIDDLFAAADVL